MKFVGNLHYYLYEARFVAGGGTDYPVGILDDIRVDFVHYQSFDEAVEEWNSRLGRIYACSVEMRTSYIFLRSRYTSGHTGFQRLKESVEGVPNSDERTVAEKTRPLLRFGVGSMRHRDVFDVYYHLLIKGIDVEVLGSCTAKDIFGDESMCEKGRADVYACLEKFFSDRRCVRQLFRVKDNWLELPVGKVTAGILSEVKKFMTKR